VNPNISLDTPILERDIWHENSETSDSAPKWNPYYVAYASAHGESPEKMLDADSIKYEGGCMTGFILWISEQCKKFKKEHPEAMVDNYTIGDRDAWGRFLNEAGRITGGQA
jgi:hypothetical protein